MTEHPKATTRKLYTLPVELIGHITDFRHANRIGTEAETVRTLLRQAIEAARERNSNTQEPHT
jgi:hypothetical protein